MSAVFNSAPGQFSPEKQPLLVNSREASRLLQISERTLWTLTKAGEIPSVRLGRSVRYSVDALRRWIDANHAGG